MKLTSTVVRRTLWGLLRREPTPGTEDQPQAQHAKLSDETRLQDEYTQVRK